MKLYSALVKDKQTKEWEYILNKEYKTKGKFIEDLRGNGYAVNPYRVKESQEFDRIVNETNMTDEDWGMPLSARYIKKEDQKRIEEYCNYLLKNTKAD